MLSTSLHGGQKTDTRAHGGLRPALLAEPHGVQQVLRHTVGQLVDAVPLVSLLDDPVPQTVDTVLDFFRALDQPVDEQVIAVPKISFDRVSQRLVERRLPQICGTVGGSADRSVSDADRLADRGADRWHFSSSW